MKDGFKKAATFCLLHHKNKWLLLCRTNDPNKGKYVPVGGKIEAYEAPFHCVIREVKEETGIDIAEPKYCGTLVETSPTSYNWISFIYKAEIDDIKPPYCDEGTLHWVHNDDLIHVPTPPTDLLIYKNVLLGKKFALNAVFDADLNMLEMWDDLE